MYDDPLSNFAFNCTLRRYTWAAAAAVHAAAANRAQDAAARAHQAQFGGRVAYVKGNDYGNGNGAVSHFDPNATAAAAAAAAASPIAALPLPRARHHALLVPVLRLAGTLVNALASSSEAGADTRSLQSST